jgi:uncharacterized coiled-coil DUF342 family protein
MDLYKEINALLDEIRQENDCFNSADHSEEQIDALKEMLDGFMQGAQKVREKIDSFNERRWQR